LIINSYLNTIRDWVASGSGTLAIASGGMGTNQTTVSPTDTGLNGNANRGTAGMFVALVKTTADRAIQAEYYKINDTTATGSYFGEFGLNTGTTLVNRQIFEKIKKKRFTSFTFVTNLQFI